MTYKYLQSFYYLSVKFDDLNPILSAETLRLNFRFHLLIEQSLRYVFSFSRLRVSNAHNSGMKLSMCTLSISLRRRFFALSVGTLITKILACSKSLVFPELIISNAVSNMV